MASRGKLQGRWRWALPCLLAIGCVCPPVMTRAIGSSTPRRWQQGLQSWLVEIVAPGDATARAEVEAFVTECEKDWHDPCGLVLRSLVSAGRFEAAPGSVFERACGEEGVSGCWERPDVPGLAKLMPGGVGEVGGGLTADEVGKIIRKHWNEVKSCWEHELSVDPDARESRVMLRFRIDSMGRVGIVGIGKDRGPPAVEVCTMAAAIEWRFPPPRKGGVVDVNYPYVFKSSP